MPENIQRLITKTKFLQHKMIDFDYTQTKPT